MADENARMWHVINELSQHRVRTDERMSSLERRQDEALREMSKSEARTIAAIENLGSQMKESIKVSQDGWKETAQLLSNRMDNQEREAAEARGEQRGRKEERTNIIKKTGAWTAVITVVVSLLAYMASIAP